MKTIQKYYTATIIFSFISSLLFAQEPKIIKAPFIQKPYYILSLPSTECTNCKASASDIVRYFAERKGIDSLIVITDNDAGAYYIENNPNIGKYYNIIIDSALSKQVSSNGKATLCYRERDIIKTEEINSPVTSLLKNLNHNSSDSKYDRMSPFRIDSVKLKYNIFGSFANSIIQTRDNNILIFSKKDNAGCFLLPDARDSISSLKQASLSNHDYDRFIDIFKAKPHSNVPQKKIRDFTSHSNISFARIYQIVQSQSHSLAYFSFFTAHSDTIRKDSVSMQLIYNIGVAKSDGISAENPLSIGSYPDIMPIEPFLLNGLSYKLPTIIPAMVVTDDYFYLPCSPAEKDKDVVDSIFFLAKFKFTPGQVGKPIEVIKYKYGNFSEECLARGASGTTPVVLNKVRNIFDFGSSSPSIDLNNIALPLANDTIKYVFDYRPLKDGKIKLIALTKKNKTIAAVLNSRKIEAITVLDELNEPIACMILADERLIKIDSKGKYVITSQYKSLFSQK